MLRMLVCMQFCKETEQYRDIHKERERERERELPVMIMWACDYKVYIRHICLWMCTISQGSAAELGSSVPHIVTQ